MNVRLSSMPAVALAASLAAVPAPLRAAQETSHDAIRRAAAEREREAREEDTEEKEHGRAGDGGEPDPEDGELLLAIVRFVVEFLLSSPRDPREARVEDEDAELFVGPLDYEVQAWLAYQHVLSRNSHGAASVRGASSCSASSPFLSRPPASPSKPRGCTTGT